MGFVHHSRTAPRLENQGYLKEFPDYYELTIVNSVRESGWEEEKPSQKVSVPSDSKQRRNLQRAKNKIFELSYCNEWDWFFTGTLDQTKQSRDDLDGFRRRFSQLVRNLKRRNGIDIDYLIIPELHADFENWHCHGLLKGIPENQIQTINGKMSWARYADVFGFNDLQVIRNHEAVSKYLTKYITKSIDGDRGVTELNKNSYFHSQKLRMAEIKKSGTCRETSSEVPILSDTILFESEFAWKYRFKKTDYSLNQLYNLFE